MAERTVLLDAIGGGYRSPSNTSSTYFSTSSQVSNEIGSTPGNLRWKRFLRVEHLDLPTPDILGNKQFGTASCGAEAPPDVREGRQLFPRHVQRLAVSRDLRRKILRFRDVVSHCPDGPFCGAVAKYL